MRCSARPRRPRRGGAVLPGRPGPEPAAARGISKRGISKRRRRRLELDELVWAALIAYPRYVSRRSGLFVEVEEAVEELARWREEPAGSLRLWQRLFRRWGQMRERFRVDNIAGHRG